MTNGVIVVGGSVAQRPGNGGHAWVFLNYLLGLRRLGWDVLFVDRLDPGMGVDLATGEAWLRDVMAFGGLEDDWVLLCDGGGDVVNGSRARLREVARAAAALLNVNGFVQDPDVLTVGRRVFVDIDPGFGQMWQALGWHESFVDHDLYVTVGANIGQPGCTIPTCGLPWITTRPPVVLDRWAPSRRDNGRFTSVVTWRGPFEAIDYEGTRYGLRAHELRRFVDLPERTGAPLELALAIDTADAADRESLLAHGWLLADPGQVAGTPSTYRDYVTQSAGELMVAKNLYVRSRSGWFSDRSACYLAAGRPVVAQDTGLRATLPDGEGLLFFESPDEAADALGAVRAEPDRHGRAAREVAAEHFGSDTVLTALLRHLSIA